jgi:hypothetical protein
MKVTVIKNSTWGRGETSPGALFYDKLFCCLGCSALKENVPIEEMERVILPCCLKGRYEDFKDRWSQIPSPGLLGTLRDKGIVVTYSTLEDVASRVNDNIQIDEELRIKLLRLVFKEAGEIIRWYPNR